MRRRGFTLIELLVIVGIIAAMITVSVVSVRAGQGAARVKGATRDIVAVVRHARSVALVSQEPSIITYSTETVDDEVCAKVEVHATQLMSTTKTVEAETLEGERVVIGGDGETESKEDGAPAEGTGAAVEDILFAPISTDVVKGMRIKVTKEGETLAVADEARAKPKVSVFSNVDYLLGRFNEAKASATAKEEASATTSIKSSSKAAVSEDQEPVSVVWETNGRVEPHRVWIYPDGSSPDKGLSIKIDRFGAVKVLGRGEEDE